MKRMKHLAVAAAIAGLASTAAQADVVLGGFDFNSTQFGNTLLESDGGTFSAGNFLNVVNGNPGNPGYLTGANFNTGIANIGFQGSVQYTIGYGSAIVNGAGADFGVVTARFSRGDTVRLAVSGDGGTTFSGFGAFGAALGVDSGVNCSYFYRGIGPLGCDLFVTLIDLSDFGVALGASVNSIKVTGDPELDLIRVAGLARQNEAPEPGTLALLGLGLAGIGALRRRR